MAEITTSEFATELGTDPRTVRKYLRSITPKDEQPGKGGRWALDGTKRSLNTHRKQFNEWHKKQLEERAARAAKAAEDAAATVEVEDDETLDD